MRNGCILLLAVVMLAAAIHWQGWDAGMGKRRREFITRSAPCLTNRGQ